MSLKDNLWPVNWWLKSSYLAKKLNNITSSSRTYIFPTTFGFIYALCAFLLINVAFIYNNNMVYLLVFLMASLGLSSLVLTNNNIKNCVILRAQVLPFYAHEKKFLLQVTLQNSSVKTIRNIEFKFRNQKKSIFHLSELAPQQEKTIKFEVNNTFSRGEHILSSWLIQSTYPFSMARSWKYNINHISFLTYPALSGKTKWPKSIESSFDSLQQQQSLQQQSLSFDEFKDHKPYSKNDSFRRLDWKIFAKKKQLYIKNFNQENSSILNISEQDLLHLDYENRIQQAALWVHEATKKQSVFVFNWQDFYISSLDGVDFYSRIMRFLAKLPRAKE